MRNRKMLKSVAAAVVTVLLMQSIAEFPALVQSSNVTHHDITHGFVNQATSIMQDIDRWNASCFPKDTCRTEKVSRLSDPPDWSKRNCLCDETCVIYGDCCPDSRRYQPDQQRTANAKFTCLSLRQYSYNWVVNTCPPTRPPTIPDAEYAEMRMACETEPTDGQIHADPIGHMLVTSLLTGVTYRNLNCALCRENLTSSSLRHATEEESPIRVWNPRLECSSILAGSKLVNHLDKDVLQSKVQWDVEQKMWGLMIDSDGKGERFHSCFVDPALPDDLQSYLRPCQPSIDTCPDDWNDADVREKCLSYTSYVYRSQEIYRNVHCALCNLGHLADVSCNSSAVSFRKLPPDWREFNPSAFALLFDLKDSDGSGAVGRQRSCADAGQLYDPFAKKCRTVYCSHGSVYRQGRCVQEPTTTTTTATTTTATTTTTTTATTEIPDDADGIQEDHTEGSLTPAEENHHNDEIETGMDELMAESERRNFTLCPKFLLADDEVEWLDNGTMYVPSHGKSYAAGSFENDSSAAGSGGVWICASDGIDTVAKFDPVLGWVTVAGLGLSELCLFLHLSAFLLSPDLRNISGRNLASLSLALFTGYGSFIAAQFVNPHTNRQTCLAVSISTFYFFLSAFWWTSVLAWDVWRTIRLATVQLRCSSSGQQWGKFIGYSLYGWLLPAGIVAIASVAEYTDWLPWLPDDFRPHFGQGVCWFGRRKAILIYFAGPLAAILLVNVALFASSAHMIRTTTAKSPTNNRSSKNNNSNNKTRKQLGLYVRLALIMGLSWLAGLVAGAADIAPLWYVFVALCSLQGVFILLAYTCNPKVMRSIRSRLGRSAPRQSTYRTALVGTLKSDHQRRLGLEAVRSDSHDSHASNTSQTSQTSQTSLTHTSNSTVSGVSAKMAAPK